MPVGEKIVPKVSLRKRLETSKAVWRNVFPQPAFPLRILGSDVRGWFRGGGLVSWGSEYLVDLGPGRALDGHRGAPLL